MVRYISLGLKVLGLALFSCTFMFVNSTSIAAFLGLKLTMWGLANTLLIAMVILWYLLDMLLPRRQVYQIFLLKERPVYLEVRYARRLLLLSLPLLAIISAWLSLNGVTEAGDFRPFDPQKFAPLSILISAYLAGIGWMYTTFETQKAHRAAQTLSAIRDHMHGDLTNKHYEQVFALTTYFRRMRGLQEKARLPLESKDIKLSMLSDDNRPEGKLSTTLGNALTRLFNSMNALAFGVRQGHLDLTTVHMVLRSRFVRLTYVFFEFIQLKTAAKPDGSGRFQATNRTWEHLLWLVEYLDHVESDKIEPRYIIRPPDNIEGKRLGKK